MEDRSSGEGEEGARRPGNKRERNRRGLALSPLASEAVSEADQREIGGVVVAIGSTFEPPNQHPSLALFLSHTHHSLANSSFSSSLIFVVAIATISVARLSISASHVAWLNFHSPVPRSVLKLDWSQGEVVKTLSRILETGPGGLRFACDVKGPETGRLTEPLQVDAHVAHVARLTRAQAGWPVGSLKLASEEKTRDETRWNERIGHGD